MSHTKQCHMCEGTGWETKLVPCSNEFWYQDDPDVDRYGLDRTTPLPYRQGRAIAAQAYTDECRKHGREPDWELFNGIVGDLQR